MHRSRVSVPNRHNWEKKKNNDTEMSVITRWSIPDEGNCRAAVTLRAGMSGCTIERDNNSSLERDRAVKSSVITP